MNRDIVVDVIMDDISIDVDATAGILYEESSGNGKIVVRAEIQRYQGYDTLDTSEIYSEEFDPNTPREVLWRHLAMAAEALERKVTELDKQYGGRK